MDDKDLYYSIPEAMEKLGVTEHKIRFKLRKGEIRTRYFASYYKDGVKMPRYTGLLKQDIDELYEDNKNTVKHLTRLLCDHLTEAEARKAAKLTRFSLDQAKKKGWVKPVPIGCQRAFNLIPVDSFRCIKTLSEQRKKDAVRRAMEIINDSSRSVLGGNYFTCEINRPKKKITERECQYMGIVDYASPAGMCSLKFASRYLDIPISDLIHLLNRGKISRQFIESEDAGYEPKVIIKSMVKYKDVTDGKFNKL